MKEYLKSKDRLRMLILATKSTLFTKKSYNLIILLIIKLIIFSDYCYHFYYFPFALLKRNIACKGKLKASISELISFQSMCNFMLVLHKAQIKPLYDLVQ